MIMMDENEILSLLKKKDLLNLVKNYSMTNELNITTDILRKFKFDFRIDGLSAIESKEFIGLMEKEGLLEKTEAGNIIACPYCNSANVMEFYECPECGSVNIKKIYVIEHVKCGKIFTSDNLNIKECPKCGEKISSPEDLKIEGGSFRCEDCGATFENPVIRYRCLNCGKEFGLREVQVRKIEGFKIREDAKELLKTVYVYGKVAESLLEDGYDVEVPGEILGSSGVSHLLPIIVKDSHRNTYTIDLLGLESGINEEYVLRKFIKIIDTPNITYLFIVKSNFNEKVFKTLPKNNVAMIRADDLSTAINKIKEFISERNRD